MEFMKKVHINGVTVWMKEKFTSCLLGIKQIFMENRILIWNVCLKGWVSQGVYCEVVSLRKAEIMPEKSHLNLI